MVLNNNYSPASVGCWEGPRPETWNRLLQTLRGGALLGSGAKLMRVGNRQVAERVWAEAYPDRRMPVHQV